MTGVQTCALPIFIAETAYPGTTTYICPPQLVCCVRLCLSAVFEELLLDADWSVNAGSWMCHSCSSFFQPFFHCYCPVGFGRRMDPNGDYIR